MSAHVHDDPCLDSGFFLKKHLLDGVSGECICTMDSELNSFKSQVDVDSVVPPNIMLKVGVGSNVSSVSMWYRELNIEQI